MDSNPALCKVISDRIVNSPQKRISFAEYMDLALYHPEYGYYATGAINLGKEGDFFTSVHLGADFGELLAEQFVQMWQILGKPQPFQLIEMGAGQGYLALDILKYIQQQYPDFLAALQYVIVEKSPALRNQQQQRLQEFPVSWCNLAEIPTNSVVGCFFATELVDALPVHQFQLEAGKLQEIYVTTSTSYQLPGKVQHLKSPQPPLIRGEGRGDNQPQLHRETLSSGNNSPNRQFIEIAGEPSTPELVKYFDLVEIDISNYPENYRSEINLAALDWLSIVGDCLQRGYVLTIDYGYPASRYYNPRRSQGTLQCYWQHQRHNDPYINIGRQDITAHVDFTALSKWGDRCGLTTVGFTQQALFLMALGLGDRIAALSHTQTSVSQLLHRRDRLHQLLDPLGLGGFGVLVQSQGLTKAEFSQPLKGLTEPG